MKEIQLDDLVPEFWPDQWHSTPLVHPEYNRVRRISNNHVAKTVRGGNNWINELLRYKLGTVRELSKELKVHNSIYDAGISAPKHEGVFKVTIRDTSSEEGIVLPGLVMEYIPGQTLEDLYKQDRATFAEALKQRDAEIQKAKDLVFLFYGGDHLSWVNALWNPHQQKTYLIDFAGWEGR